MTVGACRVARLGFATLMLAALLAAAGPAAAAQAPGQPGIELPPEALAEGHVAEEHHEESIWAVIARLFNFAILAGTLVVLLRRPLAAYLTERRSAITGGLAAAAATRQTAAERLREIDRRLQELPAEIDALEAQGAREIAAEQARITQAAAAERERLMEQTRREIDLQLRIARRTLIEEAARLAVDVAARHIRRMMTPEDQMRLLDRYAGQLGAAREDTLAQR